MKRFIWIVIVICLSEIVLADIVINEIMYNPEGNDNNKEFVEIYSEDYVNLSGYVIADSSSSDTLEELQYFDSGYSLIVEEGFNHSLINASIYSVGATIGNNLGNSGENITLLYPNETIADSVVYSNEFGNGNGYSLELNGDNFIESLVIGGTPGLQNSVYVTEEDEETEEVPPDQTPEENETEEITVDYNKVRISEFLPDPEGYDNAGMPDGEWVELFNLNEIEVDLTGMYFEDAAGHKLLITDTTVAESIIPANGYVVVYTNGKSGFLNNDFDSLLFYDMNDNLIDNVSYIDPVEGNSYALVEDFWQSTMPTPGEENVNYSAFSESRFSIEKIYDLGSDKKAKFGQTIRAKVNIWKGDDTKNSISLWVEGDERVSKYSKTNVYTKYTNYSLALPVQIYPNCDEDYKDGIYTLYIGWSYGYDVKDSYDFPIEEISKEVCVGKKKPVSKNKKFIYELVSRPEQIKAGERFDIVVNITNNENVANRLEVWSYVYRGSKSYTGDREENKKTLTVGAKDFASVKLANIIEEAAPGSYKLKVRIRKNDQKTLKEITEPIDIVEEEEEKDFVQEALEQNITERIVYTNPKGILYESTSIKMRNLASYFIIGMMSLLLVMLIWKK